MHLDRAHGLEMRDCDVRASACVGHEASVAAGSRDRGPPALLFGRWLLVPLPPPKPQQKGKRNKRKKERETNLMSSSNQIHMTKLRMSNFKRNGLTTVFG